MLPMKEDIEFLEHFGVKGMKWGVRRKRRENTLARAGEEGSKLSTRLRATARLGPIDLIRGRGIRGGARRKSLREAQRSERFDKGQATARDVLVRAGSLRPKDLIPVRGKNKDKTRTSHDAAWVAAAGAVYAAAYFGSKAARKSM